MRHPAKIDFSIQACREGPQARRISNPEVETKHLARTERPFFKQRANCSRKIIRSGPSGPGIVKQIRSPLVKVSPPLLHCRESEHFWAIHRLKFGVDRPGFQPFEREETDRRSLFQINPKRICRLSRFDVRLTRQIPKGQKAVSRKIREMGSCYLYLLFTR
jgi:hypothetical protein